MAALGFGLLLWIAMPLKPFQDCIHQRKNDQAYRALHGGPFLIAQQRARLRLNLACGLDLAEVYENAFVALSGLVVICFTAALWLSTQRLWKNASRQLEVAEATANATAQSVAIAMAGQRAFIQITPIWRHAGSGRTVPMGMGDVVALNRPAYSFGIKMDNIGGTPASNIRNHIDWIFLPGEMPDNFAFTDSEFPLSQGGMLAPKQWLFSPNIPREGVVTADEIEQIQRGETTLYIYGWVRYFDSFPNTPERVTKFCYSVRVTGNPQSPVNFVPHGRHNCADEGCDEQARPRLTARVS